MRPIVVLWLALLWGPSSARAAPPGATASPEDGCQKSSAALPTSPGATAILSLTWDGLEREYRLHLPAYYEPDHPAPLVLSFHGYTGSAAYTELEWTRMSEHADAHGYVVVYPQSTSFEARNAAGDRREITSWNDGACNASPGPAGPTCAADADRYPCPPECGECGRCNWCSCHDDVGFVGALLDELERTLCLDPERVFAVGYSNGGMFVHRLGCALGERLAAVAPLHGTLARGFNCAPESGAASLLLLGGTEDRTVPIDGSASNDGFLYTPLSEATAAWAAALGCGSDPAPLATPWDGTRELACLEHRGCQGATRVARCTWRGAHDWPRGRQPGGNEPWGNDLLWWFFEQVVE